jgi:hypothetical protein
MMAVLCSGSEGDPDPKPTEGTRPIKMGMALLMLR